MTSLRTTDATESRQIDDAERREPPLIGILCDALAYAREREYTGWDYGDGMSSRILQSIPVDNRWLNLAFQETIKRSPINVRPLFLVEQRRNYKGGALFAMANLNAHQLTHEIDYGGADDVDYRREAHDLLDWLVAERCRGYSGFCGGHRHEIQHLHTKGVPNDPDVVSTSFAVEALLRGSALDPSYAERARAAVPFLENELHYREVDGGAQIDYHLNHPSDSYTINAGALGARLLIDLYDHFGEESYRGRATKLLDYIANIQQPIGGWTYRHPPSASHLSMDNHHNGFVIECFLRYREVTGSDRYDETIADAVTFYREVLFEPNGAPNWDEESAYPKDIHACAQGILVFTYAGDLAFAERILEWTLEHLYAGDGHFHYRKHRYYTRRITLMRWCQAWMAFAISEYLAAVRDTSATQTAVAE